jgi:hypothetical protein
VKQPVALLLTEPRAIRAITQEFTALAGGLLPGTLVNARVKAVLSDGLQVSFLTYFTGTVDPFHLGQARCSAPFQQIDAGSHNGCNGIKDQASAAS